MSDLQELTDELMQDPEFVKEFEAIYSLRLILQERYVNYTG